MTIRRILRQNAQAWWYHKQLREYGDTREAVKREHASVRSDVKTLRECLATGGYLTLGRGGYSLHYSDNGTLSGYDCEGGVAGAALLLGIPTIDSRTIPDSRIVRTISLPLIKIANPDPAPWGGMSYAPLPIVAWLYQALGATLHNLTPVQPAKDQFRSLKDWERMAMVGYNTGNEPMLGKAMLMAREETE